MTLKPHPVTLISWPDHFKTAGTAPVHVERVNKLKSVQVDLAYEIIAITLKLLGQFGKFLDQDNRCNPPDLFIPF